MPQRFAYLVLAHEEPMLALRLLTRVRTLSPTAAITLRHDQPGGYLTDAQIRAAGAEPFRSEIATAWGEWSLVEATVELLAHARATTDADWLVLYLRPRLPGPGPAGLGACGPPAARRGRC